MDHILKQHRLRGITQEGNVWAVESISGNTYHVRSLTVLDENGCMYFQWQCSCPARLRCRHIDAVEQMSWDQAVADEDYDGMDVLERHE